MPSLRRRLCPIGYSTTTSFSFLPSRKLDRQCVRDRTLARIEIVLRELLVLDAHDLVAQCIDTRIGSNVVFVIFSGQAPEDQRHRDHVLDAVIAIGRIIERPLLVDDADARFVRANRDLLDIRSGLAELV